jgi:hypothetical protein
MPAETRRTDGPVMAAIVATAATAVALCIGALVGWGWAAARGAAAGGLLATINLWVLARVMAGVVAPGRRLLWGLLAISKFFALLAGAALLLVSGIAPPLAIVVGLGALPVGLVLGSLLGPRPGDDARDTVPRPASGRLHENLVSADADD